VYMRHPSPSRVLSPRLCSDPGCAPLDRLSLHDALPISCSAFGKLASKFLRTIGILSFLVLLSTDKMLAEICLGSSFSKYSVVSLLSENTTNLDSGLMDLFKRVFFKYSINTSNFGSSFTFSHSVDNSLSN